MSEFLLFTAGPLTGTEFKYPAWHSVSARLLSTLPSCAYKPTIVYNDADPFSTIRSSQSATAEGLVLP
jgi:hypothetical protein